MARGSERDPACTVGILSGFPLMRQGLMPLPVTSIPLERWSGAPE